MDFSPFVFFTLILMATLIAMVALKILRAPTVPAYFAAGIVLGPKGLNVLESSDTVHFAGELGIILLLFSIGLKFNLSALRTMRYYVLGLGSLQVASCALVFSALAWLFTRDVFIATLIGFIIAMSSTALISQILLEENSVTSPVGRRAIAVLLMQDLVVIPLIIIYSGQSEDQSLLVTTALLALKIVVVLFTVLFIGPRLMRGWLNWAARYHDKELFIFNLIAVITLSSLLTGVFGLSYVLGAFLAGILIAETFHWQRVERLMEPFRQLFMGFFFITLGILIDPTLLIENAGVIALLTIALLAVKTPLIYYVTRAFKTHAVSSARVAFLLGGTGEFGFVLIAVANTAGIISEELFQLLVPVNMLAMLAVPLLNESSHAVIKKLFPGDAKVDDSRTARNVEAAAGLDNHAIICGFGRTGHAVASILRTMGVNNYIAVEDDYSILQSAQGVEPVVYGRSEYGNTLSSVAIDRAAVVIVTYTDTHSASLAIKRARELNPSVQIIAKAETQQQAEALRAAGADKTPVQAYEAGFTMAENALKGMNSASLWMLPHLMANIRSGKNPLLKGDFSVAADDSDDGDNRRMLGYHIAPSVGAAADDTGEREPIARVTLADIPEATEVVAWRRDKREMNLQKKDEPLLPDDELILFGDEEALTQTVQLLDKKCNAAKDDGGD